MFDEKHDNEYPHDFVNTCFYYQTINPKVEQIWIVIKLEDISYTQIPLEKSNVPRWHLF